MATLKATCKHYLQMQKLKFHLSSLFYYLEILKHFMWQQYRDLIGHRYEG